MSTLAASPAVSTVITDIAGRSIRRVAPPSGTSSDTAALPHSPSELWVSPPPHDTRP
jgi:hypothetical protein